MNTTLSITDLQNLLGKERQTQQMLREENKRLLSELDLFTQIVKKKRLDHLQLSGKDKFLNKMGGR